MNYHLLAQVLRLTLRLLVGPVQNEKNITLQVFNLDSNVPVASERRLLFVDQLDVVLHSSSGRKAPAAVIANVGPLLLVDLKLIRASARIPGDGF